MRLEDIKHIGVLGGGVMGGGIAQIMTAIAGYQVTVRDLTQQILDDTQAEIEDNKWGVKRAVERGKLGFDQAIRALNQVNYTLELADLADCDLIIEAVPERLELKQQVFKELDGIAKEDCIFASNTSGFVIAEIAQDVSVERKKKFVGMHFSNPVPVMRMLEVISTDESDPEVAEICKAVGEASGRAVCMVKDKAGTYGFILNRVFAAAAREAKQIVDDGLASPEDVDKAMITGRNWPAAFFGSRGGIGKKW
ncbi:MAG: 3-hydroxyacyl-CoA dehydrogenase family protein [Gammaproteobacteria bacterium]|nr:3-hydroxyacyl-CoA dehydrogenase family protein [Gammaproteobacteria bacterium]